MVTLNDTLSLTVPQSLTDYYQEGSEPQTASIQLVCRYGIAQKLPQYGGKNGILVALGPNQDGAVASNAQASAGPLMADSSDDVYWFTKSVNVEITSGPGMSLVLEGPGTTAVNEQVSTSISFNAGFFGDAPTAGGSYNSSVSRSLPDFAVTDQSDLAAGTIQHLYHLAATSAGAFNSDKDAFTWDDDPAEPPDMAKSNLPLISQGFWVCGDGFTGRSNFTVTVTHVLLALDEHLSTTPDRWQETSYAATLNLPEIDWSAVTEPSLT